MTYPQSVSLCDGKVMLPVKQVMFLINAIIGNTGHDFPPQIAGYTCIETLQMMHTIILHLKLPISLAKLV